MGRQASLARADRRSREHPRERRSALARLACRPMATCYRHPSRETGVSYSICGRPICPDCMTPTPVGMRCPECIRQRTKVTHGAAAFGGSVHAPATYALIAINVAVFLVQIGTGHGGIENNASSLIPEFGLF